MHELLAVYMCLGQVTVVLAVSNNAAYLTIAVTSYHATMPLQTVETRPSYLIAGINDFCAVKYAVGLFLAFVTHDHT